MIFSKQHLLCLALVAAAGCASTQSKDSTRSRADGPSASTLGANDVFEVRVFNEKELTGLYRVDSAGGIEVPLAGRIDARGKTPSEVGALIEAGLAAYLRNPQVSVFVTEFNSKKIYVLGEVKQPGTFIYEDGMTVVQAITLAGGFDKLAAKNGTYVTRLVDGQEQQIRVQVEDIGEGRATNLPLSPGDIVYVPETVF